MTQVNLRPVIRLDNHTHIYIEREPGRSKENKMLILVLPCKSKAPIYFSKTKFQKMTTS